MTVKGFYKHWRKTNKLNIHEFAEAYAKHYCGYHKQLIAENKAMKDLLLKMLKK
jgi:hypothetical protein